ncbi:MAG: phage virion morphogenesis protein [Rickettsiales bacterium]|nr:phage virion morphogenesis protein [Rickettsiales bacterium]
MIRLEFQGQDEVLKKLSAVSDRKTRGAIMDDFSQYLLAEVSNRFENEKGPDGEAWEKSYRAKQEAGQTLSDTGILKQSISSDHSADRLEIGSAMVYARIHQEGGIIKPINQEKLSFSIGGRFIQTDQVQMPARPYLGFSDADEEELINIVHDHWEGNIQ